MKHLKTFEAWEDVMRGDEIRRENKIKEVQEMNIQEGDFVTLKREYDDVWHEVEWVGETYLKVYTPVDTYNGSTEVKSVLTSFTEVSKHSKDLPKDTRVFILKTGYYSLKMGNLNDIPVEYKRNLSIDSIVDED